MTDKTEAQPEALRLAAWLKEGAWHQMRLGDVEAAGRELRRQHSEIQQLKTQLSARQAAPTGLTEAVFQVLEGWNIPAPVRKILETAYYAPPPPELEPLTDEQILRLFIEMYGQEPVDITEFAEVCGRVEKHHGIGATND